MLRYRDGRFSQDLKFIFASLNTVLRGKATKQSSVFVKQHQFAPGMTVEDMDEIETPRSTGRTGSRSHRLARRGPTARARTRGSSTRSCSRGRSPSTSHRASDSTTPRSRSPAPAAGLTYVALSRLRRWGGLVLTQAVSAARMLSLSAGLERRQADERRRYGRTL
jgi:hypothetical protein